MKKYAIIVAGGSGNRMGGAIPKQFILLKDKPVLYYTLKTFLDSYADLQIILAAWNEATDRLQRTHEALQAEVRRLSDELEAKNRELARRNRLADLGQMASHVAHEVRNGLVPLKLYLSLLKRRVREEATSSEIVGNLESGFTATLAAGTPGTPPSKMPRNPPSRRPRRNPNSAPSPTCGSCAPASRSRPR